ncbi:hypothetical protein BDV95DRAFT_625916 [Massariosphaeria phaeospora]|uniref:Uncharacterized protein n=1 Tax=Massariosphaeria phaeospora TaxID=100035 RepID=A0A7C8IDD2_9PLEO|nr:hypothetical protein BDV95DRAFT_625916 [Massariosphaeria phaeospora]
MYQDEEGSLPSYEDTIKLTPTEHSRWTQTHTISPSRGLQLLDQLTLVRGQHIRSVIDTHILPLVEQQVTHGIAQTTIAMLPSEILLPAPEEESSEFSFDSGNKKKVEVIGFSSNESPQVVRLEGQMNRTEFWRAPNTIRELEVVLKESLNASPNLQSPTGSRVPPTQKPQRHVKRGLFGRMADVINQEERWPIRSSEGDMEHYGVAGQVLVKATLDDICLRTTNEFGLYDTMSKLCIVIRVDARC